ncbi:MAG: hypothetical protein ACLTW9_29920 [Enterocloster sp.]
MKNKKITALIISAALAAVSMAGCTGQSPETAGSAKPHRQANPKKLRLTIRAAMTRNRLKAALSLWELPVPANLIPWLTTKGTGQEPKLTRLKQKLCTGRTIEMKHGFSIWPP